MLTTAHILSFVNRSPKVVFKTPSRGRPFACEADATALYVTNSLGNFRKIGRLQIDTFLKERNATGARSVSHYQAQNFNASYLLAIVDAFERQSK